MIEYPRKCEFCEHVANNQASWWFHSQTHKPIPDGKLCDLGCGKQAKFIKTSGKYTCEQTTQQCSAYKERHSKDVKRQWLENEWRSRREANVNRTKNETSEQRRKRLDKQTRTKIRKRIIAENTFDRRKYNRTVLYWSRKNYKLYESTINPESLPIGRQQYHLDHKVSKFVGWLLNIPVDIISHPKNLCVIPHSDNSRKNNRCSLHPTTLLTESGASRDIITSVESRLHLVQHLIEGKIL